MTNREKSHWKWQIVTTIKNPWRLFSCYKLNLKIDFKSLLNLILHCLTAFLNWSIKKCLRNFNEHLSNLNLFNLSITTRLSQLFFSSHVSSLPSPPLPQLSHLSCHFHLLPSPLLQANYPSFRFSNSLCFLKSQTFQEVIKEAK